MPCWGRQRKLGAVLERNGLAGQREHELGQVRSTDVLPLSLHMFINMFIHFASVSALRPCVAGKNSAPLFKP